MYVRTGALEHYLSKCGPAANPASLAALQSGELWTCDQLMELILFTLNPVSVGLQESDGKQRNTQGLQRLNISQPDLSGSDSDRHMRLQLLHSLELLEQSGAQGDALKKLNSLTGAADSTALVAEVKKTGETLQRLVSSELDVEKALAGNARCCARESGSRRTGAKADAAPTSPFLPRSARSSLHPLSLFLPPLPKHPRQRRRLASRTCSPLPLRDSRAGISRCGNGRERHERFPPPPSATRPARPLYPTPAHVPSKPRALCCRYHSPPSTARAG